MRRFRSGRVRIKRVKPEVPRLRHLSQERQRELEKHAAELRASSRQDVLHVLDDGDRLQAVKDSLPHGLWQEWLRDKLQIHPKTTVENYLRAARWRRELVAQGTNVDFTFLSRSSIFDLARVSTPESAKLRVLDALVASQLPIPHKDITKIISEERRKEKPAPDPDPPPPSDKRRLTPEQIEEIRDAVCHQLRLNKFLWEGLLIATAQKRLRILVGTDGLDPLISVPNSYGAPRPIDAPDRFSTQPKPSGPMPESSKPKPSDQSVPISGGHPSPRPPEEERKPLGPFFDRH
jgi:hypothetical protein